MGDTTITVFTMGAIIVDLKEAFSEAVVVMVVAMVELAMAAEIIYFFSNAPIH